MRNSAAEAPRYSLVVPFHDEQDSVRELHRRLSDQMTGHFDPVEFVYVDDQSSDGTGGVFVAARSTTNASAPTVPFRKFGRLK